MKHALAALCAYEVVAVWTGRVPTITSHCGRWPLLGAGLVAALAVHFILEWRRRRYAVA